MKKILGILIVAIILLAGCVDESEKTYDSTLRINNLSSNNELDVFVNDDYTLLDALEYVQYTFEDIEEDDYVTANVNYSGRFVFEEDYTVQIDADEDYAIDVSPNCGEIIVQNLSNAFTITEVYISPSSDDEWGDDDLSGTIGAGNQVTWKAEAGLWDIKLVDNWGDEFVAYDNYLSVEGSITYQYDGFRKNKATGDTNAAKAKNALRHAGEKYGERLQKVK